MSSSTVTSLLVEPESGSEIPSNAGKAKAAHKKSGSRNRRKSRELAMKAVFRTMLNQSSLSDVFRDMRDDPDYNKADEDYFKKLLERVIVNLNAIDAKLANFTDRSINELSPIEHSILRVAGCELMFDISIPYRVVINEGVELAKIFGGIDGHKYINGVLDRLAADVRQAEVDASKG